MFCTASDFNLLPYSIPNLQQVANTFQPYVDKNEQKILKRLLGVQFYNEFITSRDALPAEWNEATTYLIGEVVTYGLDIWESTTENTGVEPIDGPDWLIVDEGNKWLKLEKGAEFIYSDSCCYSDYSTEWLGIKSMLVPFIFYCWLRDTFDSYSGIGVVQAKAENSTVDHPKRRLVDAWNDFARQAHAMHNFISSSNEAEPPVYYEPNYSSCPPYHLDPLLINTFGI